MVNNWGELLNEILTPVNLDDRQSVYELLGEIFGNVFGDRGYISQALCAPLRQEVKIYLGQR